MSKGLFHNDTASRERMASGKVGRLRWAETMAEGDEHWVKHCDTHWSRELPDGTMLDYWPTAGKYRIRGRKTIVGDVFEFIKEQEKVCRICDGGPGNCCKCTCGAEKWG